MHGMGVNVEGYVHSVETGGAVDGPGLRFVVFLTGCALRCLYCHNPDTWHMPDGKKTGVASLLNEIVLYSHYLKRTGGGVTATGGIAPETRRKPEKKTGEGLPYLKILIVFIVLILFGLVWLVLTGY